MRPAGWVYLNGSCFTLHFGKKKKKRELSFLFNLSYFHWLAFAVCITNESSIFVLQIPNTAETCCSTVLSCALDRISSYTVSLLKRHYSIDHVLSRVSFPLQHYQHTLRPNRLRLKPALHALRRRAVKPLPLLSF